MPIKPKHRRLTSKKGGGAFLPPKRRTLAIARALAYQIGEIVTVQLKNFAIISGRVTIITDTGYLLTGGPYLPDCNWIDSPTTTTQIFITYAQTKVVCR